MLFDVIAGLLGADSLLAGAATGLPGWGGGRERGNSATLLFASPPDACGRRAWCAELAFPAVGGAEIIVRMAEPPHASGAFTLCGVEAEIVDGDGHIAVAVRLLRRRVAGPFPARRLSPCSLPPVQGTEKPGLPAVQI